MADTINGVTRYAGVSVDTSFNGLDDQMERLQVVSLSLGDASVSASAYVQAPMSGKLKGAYLVDATGAATTDVTVTNNSNSDAAMISVTNITTVADTNYDLSADITAANASVSKGDLMTVTVAQAGGLSAMTLIYEGDDN